MTVQFSTSAVAQAGEIETQQTVEQKAAEANTASVEVSVRHSTPNLERLINRIGRLIHRFLHQLSAAGFGAREHDANHVAQQQDETGPTSDTEAVRDSLVARFEAALDRLSHWIDRLIAREPVAAPDGGEQAAPAANDAEVAG